MRSAPTASVVVEEKRVSWTAREPKPTIAIRSEGAFARTNARAAASASASAFDLLIQITRLVDGSRRLSHVTEVLRMESEVITLQDIFLAKPPDEQTAATNNAAKLLSGLRPTGLKPQFLDKMAAHGVGLQPSFFEEDDSTYRSSLAAASFGGGFS